MRFYSFILPLSIATLVLGLPTIRRDLASGDGNGDYLARAVLDARDTPSATTDTAEDPQPTVAMACTDVNIDCTDAAVPSETVTAAAGTDEPKKHKGKGKKDKGKDKDKKKDKGKDKKKDKGHHSVAAATESVANATASVAAATDSVANTTSSVAAATSSVSSSTSSV